MKLKLAVAMQGTASQTVVSEQAALISPGILLEM